MEEPAPFSTVHVLWTNLKWAISVLGLLVCSVTKLSSVHVSTSQWQNVAYTLCPNKKVHLQVLNNAVIINNEYWCTVFTLNFTYVFTELSTTLHKLARSFARRGHFAGSERRSSRLSCLRGLLCRLRQLRRIRRSLDSDSLATLIYAVVNSRVDCCNTVLAGCTKDSNGQITAGVERCCACYHRYSEVWSRCWSDTARPNALARRSRPGSLQASSDSSPVSERRTTVSVGTLHPGLQCWHAPASAFRQPSSTCRTTFPAQHLRPSGVLSCWPDGLELTPGFNPGSNEQHRLFQVST